MPLILPLLLPVLLLLTPLLLGPTHEEPRGLDPAGP